MIDHALRFTVRARAARTSVRPATSRRDSDDASLPPMGLRLRLKASFDIEPLPAPGADRAEALKRYGMIVADNGIELVHQRRAGLAVVERPAAHAGPR